MPVLRRVSNWLRNPAHVAAWHVLLPSWVGRGCGRGATGGPHTQVPHLAHTRRKTGQHGGAAGAGHRERHLSCPRGGLLLHRGEEQARGARFKVSLGHPLTPWVVQTSGNAKEGKGGGAAGGAPEPGA